MTETVIKTDIHLSNPTNDDLTARILNVIGTQCHKREHLDEEGIVFETEYELPDQDDFVMVEGDDAWGAVQAAWMHGGHLIVQASFGDGGDYFYSPTYSGQAMFGEFTEWVNRIHHGNVVRAVAL